MALILNIETSTQVCSVSISKDGEVVDSRESLKGREHGTLLTVFIEELFCQNNIQANNLDAVAVSMGPGSYTGLRIGVSVAKGICYAANIPLISVNTLKIMLPMAVNKEQNSKALYCPMIDARRMEVYSALYSLNGDEQREILAEVITEESFKTELEKSTIYFFGDGADKCKNVLKLSKAKFINGIYPSACYMACFSEKAFAESNFEDTAYFEPFYLKNFVATTPKKKVL